jgi:hypothetical protein
MGRLICPLCANSGHGVPIRSPRQPAPGLALLEKGVEKRLGSLAMTGKEN